MPVWNGNQHGIKWRRSSFRIKYSIPQKEKHWVNTLLTLPGTAFRNTSHWAASVARVKKYMRQFRHSDCKTIKIYNMQTAKKFLLFFLGLTSLMQFGLGAWILFSLNSLLNTMHMQFSDDLKVFSVYFGVCLFIIASL